MPSTKVFSFATTDAVSLALDKFLTQASSDAIARTGKFTVAFSGGSLPATASKYLAQSTSIDFSRWYVFFADERCVPHDHADSNYKLVKDHLLGPLEGRIPEDQVVAINPRLVDDSTAAALDYQNEMQSVFGPEKEKFPRFDCILLGIGPDGHTCSLFPGFAQLEEKTRWCVGIDNSPKPPPSRITLTMPVLNAAHNVAFVVTGAGKRQTIKEIIDQSDVRLPASHVVLPKGSLYWFLDDAASQDLTLNKPSEFKL